MIIILDNNNTAFNTDIMIELDAEVLCKIYLKTEHYIHRKIYDTTTILILKMQ